MTRQDTQDYLAPLAERILTYQEPNGAYHASPEFSAYKGYCWLRDGAFIAYAMSTVGYVESADSFFHWCAATILKHRKVFQRVVEQTRAGNLPDAREMPPTRYAFDGTIRDDGWENFQLDGYGTWLWAVFRHVHTHGLSIDPYREAIELTVEYISAVWDRPCYDWWEEHLEQQHISTLGCLAAGLREAIRGGVLSEDAEKQARNAVDLIMERITRQGVAEGHLTKWVGTSAVDASLLALVSPLRVIDVDSPLAHGTVKAIDTQLCVDGGVHRFRADTYYGGGQWPLLSCFLGLAYVEFGMRDKAQDLLDWSLSTADGDMNLPEQVSWHLLDPSYISFWIDRWGESASPLLWSHAMAILLVYALEEAK